VSEDTGNAHLKTEEKIKSLKKKITKNDLGVETTARTERPCVSTPKKKKQHKINQTTKEHKILFR